MSELLLCRRSVASVPYRIKNDGIAIYSMEELCYYIISETCFLDSTFMCTELCQWMEKEQDRTELASRLSALLEQKAGLAPFLEAILKDTCYCSKAEVQKTVRSVSELEHKTGFERRKIMADQYVRKNRYAKAVSIYRRLLMDDALRRENVDQTVLRGDIWHNLGTVYARLFLFEEAGNCYKKACRLNKRNATLQSAMEAFYFAGKKEEFIRTAKEWGYREDQIQAASATLDEILQKQRGKTVLTDEAKEQRALFENWKTEYGLLFER